MVHTFSNPSDVVTSATAQKLKSLIPKLSVSEARVAQYILLNLEQISFETGASIAEKAQEASPVSPLTKALAIFTKKHLTILLSIITLSDQILIS